MCEDTVGAGVLSDHGKQPCCLLLTGSWDRKARMLLVKGVVWVDNMTLISTLANVHPLVGPKVEIMIDVSFCGCSGNLLRRQRH